MNKSSIFIFLSIVIFTLVSKCFDIGLNRFFSIIFLFSTSLVLLYCVNDFIENIILKIKTNTSSEKSENQTKIKKIITNNSTSTETIIEEIIETVKPLDKNSDIEVDNNSRIIGFIERILYFIGVVSQNWTLISIVIVFKTIARYKEIDKQIKAEYFLIGSMLSLLFAIVISMVFIAFDKINNLGIVDYILSSVTHNPKGS
ncbi:putative membrane protein [Halarcobacter ebronensis]|uniref:Uncharacterized protein n=1 Tax=Halarcobacter ebronensis TaxID=1462615 RepID=A0A4Q1AYQ9_9BACT|nr:putative membrane protein [Halarcobacter ebronensis]RXK06871.1 hypothetical protein CRV07_05430 [Halarcobacter ebronensis]